MTLRVRLVRPFGPLDIETPQALFSTRIAAADADALLCEWAPTDELLSFDGPSAWYTAEPRTNRRIGVLAHPDQRRFLRLLRPEQMLHHAHADPRFRVPHMTHASAERTRHAGRREHAAAAVVSNYGGPVHNRGPGVRFRNDFVTAHGVALFGRRSKWRRYRRSWWSWPRLPSAFVSEIDGVWSDKIELLAHYHTAVCLENTLEPFYFSEKLVDAVRAGCVPVYRAHPTVREGILRGASWVDPADFRLDAARTLEHALSLEREEIAARNFDWLGSEAVAETSQAGVWAKIAEALAAQG